MASQDERLLILKMIDEGKISADEGARLLAAIRPTGGEPNREPGDGGKPTAEESFTTKTNFGSGTSQDGVRIKVENVEPDAAGGVAGAGDGNLANRGKSAHSVRVRVSDPATNHGKIDVNVPIKIVEWGMRFIPETSEAKIENLRAAVYEGKIGSIIDLKDDSDATRVEVSLV